MTLNQLIAFFIILFTSACGFTPDLKNVNPKKQNIKSINIFGNNNQVFYVKNTLKLIENKNLKKGYTINLKINDNSSSHTKNASGITTEENISISISLTIENEEKKLILAENFSNSRIISVTNNPSSDREVKKIEKQNILDDIINQIEYAIRKELL